MCIEQCHASPMYVQRDQQHKGVLLVCSCAFRFKPFCRLGSTVLTFLSSIVVGGVVPPQAGSVEGQCSEMVVGAVLVCT